MAPLDSSVHSANYQRGVLIISPHPYTYLIGHAFSPKGPSGRLPHKEERRPPCVGLSPINVENNIKHPRNNGEQDELQHANTHLSYRLLRKNVAAPGDYPVQASAQSVNPMTLTIKTEPNSRNTPCSFFKTLSLDYWPPTRTPNHPNHEQDAGIIIKSEPGQHLIADPEPKPFDRKDSGEDKATVHGSSDTGKPQVDQISPSISDLQPCRDAHDRTPDESQIQTKISGAGGCSIPSPRDLTSTYRSPTNVVRPSAHNQRRIFPYPRFGFYPRLIVRPPRLGNRSLAQAPAPLLQDPQPPGDNDSGLPSHQDAPQSSRLYKSLYGLAQCLRSQAGVAVSSLNSTDASNAPVFNQAGPSGNSASSSNAAGVVNGSVNNLEQYSIPGAREITSVLLDLDLLDSESLVRLGAHCFDLAIQLGVANVGPSQNYIPDPVSVSPNAPIPLSSQPDQLGAHRGLPATQHSPIYGTQVRPQYHFPAPYPGGESPSQQPSASASASQLEIDMTHTGAFPGEESSFDHLNEHEGVLPNDIVPNQPTASSPGCNGVRSEVAPSPSFNGNIGQYFHNFQATGPGPELPPPGDVNQIPNPRTCPWRGCGKEFSRANLLKGHMFQHDGNRRFPCPFSNCGKAFVHPSGLSRHS
ncbi:unnamed protein product, partial [Rhizoctonia solani]